MAREIGDVGVAADAEVQVSGSVDILLELILATATVSVVARRRRRSAGDGAAPWWWHQYCQRILAEKAAEAERLRLQNLVDGDVFVLASLPILVATGVHDPDADVSDFLAAAFPFLLAA